MDRFEKFLDYIFEVEGGYTNDENDRGGATNFGITEEEAREFGYTGDMKDLTKDFAKNIYLKKYYLGNKLDKILNNKVALSIFDWAVNSGGNGTKNAQIAINQLTNANLDVDGIIGNKTLEALNVADPEKFLEVYHNLQRIYYKGKVEADRTQERFLTGWLNRVQRKEEYLKDWDKENVGTENKKFSFSQRSLNNLKGVDERLVNLCKRVLEKGVIDFVVVEGLRTIERQRELVRTGASQTMKSYHLRGKAVDLYPYPIPENLNDKEYRKKWFQLGELMEKTAKEMKLNITWGHRWKKFDDTPHFQLED